MKNEIEVHYHVHESDFDEFNRLIGFQACYVNPIVAFLLFQDSVDIFLKINAASYDASMPWRTKLTALKRWMIGELNEAEVSKGF